MKANIPCTFADEHWIKELKSQIKVASIVGVTSEGTAAIIHFSDEKPEPQKTYRYEKVTESIFDLKEEFERGLLGTRPQDVHFTIPTEEALINVFSAGGVIYRKVERCIEDEIFSASEEAVKDMVECDRLTSEHRYIIAATARIAIEKLGVK